jgi:ABC-type nickel/cobalt efflux system permease component RcnA
MRFTVIIVVFVLLLLVASSGLSQGNPFLSGTSDNQSPVTEQSSLLTNRIIGPILRRSIALQRTLQLSISRTMQSVAVRGDLGSLFVLLGASFVFGFLHVMGPGHRKMLVIGYFMGEEAKPVMGLLAGFLLSLVHAGSAIVLVGGFYWFASRSLLVSVNQAELVLFPITYGIVVLLGAWMLYQGVRGYHRHEQCHAEAKGLGGLVLSGLIPCPGASAIMIFAITSDAMLLGILAVLAMSLGMGLFLSGLGLLSIFFRRGLSRFFEDQKRSRILDLVLHLAGGILMVCFGAFLLAGCLLGNY